MTTSFQKRLMDAAKRLNVIISNGVSKVLPEAEKSPSVVKPVDKWFQIECGWTMAKMSAINADAKCSQGDEYQI